MTGARRQKTPTHQQTRGRPPRHRDHPQTFRDSHATYTTQGTNRKERKGKQHQNNQHTQYTHNTHAPLLHYRRLTAIYLTVDTWVRSPPGARPRCRYNGGATCVEYAKYDMCPALDQRTHTGTHTHELRSTASSHQNYHAESIHNRDRLTC